MNGSKKCISVICTVLILSLFIPGSSSAQKFGGGAKVGMMSADFYGSEEGVEWFSSKSGFCIGAFFDSRFAGIFEIQPGIFYTQKGAKYVDLWYTLETYTYQLDYFEIPLLFKFITPLKSPFLPYAYAGPYYSILVNDKFTIRSVSGTVEYPLTGIKEYEYGYIFGLGGEMNLGFGSILGEIDFSRSMVSFMEIDGEEIDVKNGAIAFMIGMAF